MSHLAGTPSASARPAWSVFARLLCAFALLQCLFAGSVSAQAVRPAQPAEPARVGEIAMAMGDVTRVTAGSAAPLRVGDPVREGDEFLSGAGGYLYVRTVDAGFISLRPNSRLRFEVYRFDAADPTASRIRLVLEKGVMRSISGQAVKAARDKYRLNTPVAAIGLRGTDFSVYTDAELTRVTVRQGGVVMSPLGGACNPGGFGPCEGGNARDLMAERPDALLQLRRGDPVPALLESGRQPQAPDRIAPPLPGENGAGGGSASGGNGKGESQKLALENGPSLTPRLIDHEARVADDLDTLIESRGGAVRPDTPPVTTPVAPPSIEWGRWRDVATAGPGVSLDALVAGGRKIEAMNALYALVRDPSAPVSLPRAGVFNFQLAAHDGYLYNAATGAAVPSAVGEASLSIDFDRSQFATRLTLSADGKTGLVDAKGTVYPTGEFVYDLLRSRGVVNGVVGGATGTEAGYLYHTAIDLNRQFVGATLWRR